MQNDTSEKYNPLIYRVLSNISAHASELSGKRLRGYVFAGLLLSGLRFRSCLRIALRSDGLGLGSADQCFITP